MQIRFGLVHVWSRGRSARPVRERIVEYSQILSARATKGCWMGNRASHNGEGKRSENTAYINRFRAGSLFAWESPAAAELFIWSITSGVQHNDDPMRTLEPHLGSPQGDYKAAKGRLIRILNWPFKPQRKALRKLVKLPQDDLVEVNRIICRLIIRGHMCSRTGVTLLISRPQLPAMLLPVFPSHNYANPPEWFVYLRCSPPNLLSHFCLLIILLNLSTKSLLLSLSSSSTRLR